ncbi:riboflavin synthase [Aliikangiella coralliicola]|uniref:Riboflavin synthase n=1 Tax=Aliikangiella coralliicola TaxID=2592383 RepID=A0A545U756_9GAMM|nr:riboflavin synthase [Aliikangiella coralliicola]TQV85297.1 riboflavin synthase [Aliikangiella coralliicola]
MFTGIIEAVGKIEKIESKSGDKRFTINVGKLDMSDVALGDSIACNGVCLTAIEFDEHSYVADVSGETLGLTSLANIAVGSEVNLEKALTPTTRLGGHLVSGHVDGIGEVIAIKDEARSIQYDIKAPAELAKYIAKKGSITVDGVSLTVNEVEKDVFKLNLVPHTLQETTAKNYQIGTKVNLEVDLIARYLERLLLGQATESGSNIDYQLLMKSGFVK